MPGTTRCRPRRQVLGMAALFATMPLLAVRQVFAEALAPTPSQPEGPFYPRTLPADRDADLIVVTGRPGRAEGTPLYLHGTVRSTAGTPLAGTRVEIWQCDARGRYHHVDDGGAAPLDENFQGYGETLTDGQGRYQFRTIRPVAYTGRSPHIHMKAKYPGARPLTTQVYVAGDSLAADGAFLRSFGKEARERLSVALEPAPDKEAGALRARFDIVLVIEA
ncbi:MAG TPA: intradiol ring-cleavage dioxygenase [Casimicrobiaceae bacterium]|nr:intradiol ring-cleavage dioxygenase [Casimicrobiaceae bacterium]